MRLPPPGKRANGRTEILHECNWVGKRCILQLIEAAAVTVQQLSLYRQKFDLTVDRSSDCTII